MPYQRNVLSPATVFSLIVGCLHPLSIFTNKFILQCEARTSSLFIYFIYLSIYFNNVLETYITNSVWFKVRLSPLPPLRVSNHKQKEILLKNINLYYHE